ncbi:hypothetical protein C8R44DRAFT_860191 [Mycena epipterygia]|nr:hypothetical protein C8R44DRAFT_860191 [Mycena epipterygia]
MARKVRITCSPRRGNLAAHNESEMDPAAAQGGRGRGNGNPSAAKNITGKGRKAQLTAKISAASNGAPAPRVPLAMTGEATPTAIPTPVSSVVSYALPRPSDSITFGGAGWSINGHGILDEKLNGPGDGYCFICRDGGEVVLCMVGARCENAVCLKCIGTLPPNWQTLQFSCPMCHSKREVLRLDYAKSKGEIATLQPYMGFRDRTDNQVINLNKSLATRSLSARASSESVLLLVFSLEKLPLATTPVPMLAAQLECLFPGNFAYIPVIFNLGSADGIKNLKSGTSRLAKSLVTNGELASIRRIFTVIVSHSTPTSGDIHHAPDNQGADEPREVLNMLIPLKLRKAFTALDRSPFDHLVVLLTCGSPFTIPVALKSLNEWLVESHTFFGLLGFEAEKLQPEATTCFLISVMRDFYFSAHKNFMETSLDASKGLGCHSNVIYLRGTGEKPRRFVWTHPVRAPFGVPTSIACECGAVFHAIPPPSKKRSKLQQLTSRRVKIHCELCDTVGHFSKPRGLKFTNAMDAGGIWAYMALDV